MANIYVNTNDSLDINDSYSLWADPSYINRKKITIDHTKVDDNLTDFPVLISITDNDLRDLANGGHVRNSNGYDIVFYDKYGNLLKHEIESYENTTGTLVYWVKVPSVSSAIDTNIWIYYGNDTVSTNPSTSNTWEDDYKVVHHMVDDPDTSHVADSTSNNNNGNKKAANEPIEVDGKHYKGQKFNGTDEFIDMYYDSSLEQNEISFEFSLYVEELNRREYPITWGGVSGIRVTKQTQNQLDINIRNFADTADIHHSSANDVFDSANKWYHIGVTFSDSGQWVKAWVNGVLVIDEVHTEGIHWEQTTLELGAIWQAYHFVKGTIDEFRESGTTIRSPGYMTTCYKNLYSPTTFMSWGSEEHIYYYFMNDTVDITDEQKLEYEWMLGEQFNIVDTNDSEKYIYDLNIHYLMDSDPTLYVNCWCNGWNRNDYELTIETTLSKSDRDLLLANVYPGSVEELFDVLGEKYFVDSTWQEKNTLKLKPIYHPYSDIELMHDETTIAVKTISYEPINRWWFKIKIVGIILSGDGA